MPSLNPLKLIDELIVEHGSAVIQGKHLAFLKDQIAALKEERTETAAKISQLESENDRLSVENENLRREIGEEAIAKKQEEERKKAPIFQACSTKYYCCLQIENGQSWRV